MVSSPSSLKRRLSILLEHLSDPQCLREAWKIEPENNRSFSESHSCFLELFSQILELEEEGISVLGKHELTLLNGLYDDWDRFPIRNEEILDVNILLANPEWINVSAKL